MLHNSDFQVSHCAQTSKAIYERTIKEVRQTDLRRRRIVSALLGRTTVSALLGVAAVLLAVGLLSVKVACKKTDEEK